MRDALKYLFLALLILSLPVAGYAWNEDRPDDLVRTLRYVMPPLVLIGLIGALWFRLPHDLAHDYLRDRFGNYFNRDGFCFNFLITSEAGVAYLNIFFQSQYGKRSVGHIALRPARGVFFTRAKIDTFKFRIPCSPAAFGVARVALPIPKKFQGTSQTFEVGASVGYPAGKGKRLRFRDGFAIRTDTHFEDGVGTALTVAGAAAGVLVLSSPAKLTLQLPDEVAADLPDDQPIDVTTLWKYGDPPLPSEPKS